MANIVYLLGAGASAGAIPPNRQLVKRLKYFFKLLHLYKVQKDIEYHGEKQSTQNMEELKRIISDIEQFGTPDIIGKVSSLTGNYPRLILLKNLLSCYLLYEQLENSDSEYLPHDKVDEIFNEIFPEINSGQTPKGVKPFPEDRLDSRYVEWLSTCLIRREDRSLVFPDNFKILSWNYDHQLEKAINVFISNDLWSLQKRFKIFPLTDKTLQSNELNELIEENKESWIIKINGTGGFSQEDPRHPLFDVNKHVLNNDTWEMMIKRVFQYDRLAIQGEDNKLTFAWENSKVENEAARELAKWHIHNAKIVVVIGYSFPNFNREIDREIFSEFQGEKIYVQDPIADEIIQKLDGIKPGLKDKAVPVKSKGAFTIPDEFWID